MSPPTRKNYLTDITDDEWDLVKDCLPDPCWYPNMRKPEHTSREVLNAIRYRTRSGIAWRQLPHDFPPWSTVFKRYQLWTRTGALEALHNGLRDAVRVTAGRAHAPTAGIIDSQSVKSTDVGGPHGFDGGKKVNGRKRHILVDVLGLLLAILVTPASIQDRDGAVPLLREVHREFPTVKLVWVDSAYNGDVIARAANETGIVIEMVKRTDDKKEFKILPRRWVVERTFGWLGKYRLLSKEYERTIESSTADVLHAMTMLMLRRLTTSHVARREARSAC